jgi:hypothetical protein
VNRAINGASLLRGDRRLDLIKGLFMDCGWRI